MKLKAKAAGAMAMAALVALPFQMAIASTAEEGAKDPGNGEAIAARSGNIGDTEYKFDFDFSGATDGESGRSKEDDTSSYIKVVTLNIDMFKAYIDGGPSEDGPWDNQVSYWSGDAVGNSASVTYTGEFLIMNRVYENGLGFARLTGWANSQSGSSTGWWSPDSIGSFPIIND